ncbi:MAG: hypothetical protein ACQETH_03620 [Candidatus Rifleibacteriota bacterium]
MNTTLNQFNIDIDGSYRTIDNLPAPLVSTNGFHNSKKPHLLRGR